MKQNVLRVLAEVLLKPLLHRCEDLKVKTSPSTGFRIWADPLT